MEAISSVELALFVLFCVFVFVYSIRSSWESEERLQLAKRITNLSEIIFDLKNEKEKHFHAFREFAHLNGYHVEEKNTRTMFGKVYEVIFHKIEKTVVHDSEKNRVKKVVVKRATTGK